MTVRRILAGVILLILAAPVSSRAAAVSAERLFHLGNDHYEKGEYGEAIREYEKILADGLESGPLYYNLGDAYFKAGHLGKAIVNYERALRLMPRDADLGANYQFALGSVRGKVIPEKSLWTSRAVKGLSDNFTVNEMALLCSAAYIAALLLLAAGMLMPGIWKYCLSGAVLVTLFAVFCSAVLWHEASGIGREAVTVAKKADAMYGPFGSATKFFSLNEGSVVTVLKAKDEWCKVERADGKIGWVRKSDIEKI